MKITQLLHSSILVMDVGQARAFYEGVLGLSPSTLRPDLGYPGVWYELGAQQIHVLALATAPQLIHAEHGGRDRHIALAIDDIAALKAKLDALKIAYTLSRSGRRALFCRDPDGNALEFVEVL
ncbi:MAG: glyoxalase [Betaproteobacteria bacterium RBG_16_58_11]|nr:MAG: glyoxalase [Betaproteobacteria bacterium RBG_16_58_11]OFZ97402.1 MAG: glyoxalase [Betaproteobacteria bacterium RBG_19FT_COMBO_58_11]